MMDPTEAYRRRLLALFACGALIFLLLVVGFLLDWGTRPAGGARETLGSPPFSGTR